MANPDTRPPTIESGVGAPRRRVIWLFGSALIVVNAYFGTYAYVVAQATLWTQTSLLRGPIVALFGLVLINLLWFRLARRACLSQAELLILYGMLCLSTCAGGIGFVQFLINEITAPFYFATESNNWRGLIQPHVPGWFAPQQEDVLRAFYRGHSSLYSARILSAWAVPVLAWTAFIFALFWVLLCATSLLRRQWVEEERLTFPLATLPMEMAAKAGATPFWRNRLLWAGFFLAGGLESVNFISFLYPAVPSIPIKPVGPNQLDLLFTERPWNAIGTFRLAFYPFAIGIAYLLSLEVSFSCWFLYLVAKAANILSAVLGFSEGGGGMANRAPYLREQGVGAFIGIALFSLWMARRALARAWREALRPTGADRGELMSFRMALFGGAAGLLFLMGFLIVAGLAWQLAAALLAVYLAFALALARIVSEVGSGWTFGPNWIPHVFVSDMFGTDKLSAKNLVLLHGYTAWLSTEMRDNPMPQMAQSLKISSAARLPTRWFLWALVWAALFGILCAFWAHLHIYYTYGAASAKVRYWLGILGPRQFEQVATLLKSPTPFDQDGLIAAGVGFIIVLALSRLRLEFSHWPLHPLGYALATTDSLDYMWCPFFIAWLAKLLTVRYGGIRAYRIALPFFLGLILGDFVIPGLWVAWGMFTGKQQYMSFPH